jgi:hypothetical protein
MKNLKLKFVNKQELTSNTSFATVEQLVSKENNHYLNNQAMERCGKNNIEQPGSLKLHS